MSLTRSPITVGVVLTFAIAVLGSIGPQAHEIPGDARVQAFLKPDGQTARLLLRVPLGSLIDTELPTTDGIMLDLPRVDTMLSDVAVRWGAAHVELYEEDARLAEPRAAQARIALPSDLSFVTYERALAQVTGPRLPNDTSVVATQGFLDMLFEYPIESQQSRFSIHPRFELLAMQVTTTLQLIRPDGVVRGFEMHGNPGLVRLDPRWLQAASRFVVSGFEHILDGVDHLLFLVCLVIPFRRFRTLVPIVTAFTLAHSVTLIASAYGMAPNVGWFPPLVETLIAISIVYMALENIVSPGLRRRWLLTFGFGLIHGFGFSFALRETLQFAGSHLLTSLLAFNVGVELGQILVLVLIIPALEVLFRHVTTERVGAILLSALVAHTAWHWVLERGTQLSLYQFQWPVLNAAFFAFTLRWIMVIIVAAGLVWLVFGVLLGGRGSPATGEAARRAQLFASRKRSP